MLLLAVGGCAGDGPPAGSSGSFGLIQQNIFSNGCLESACHNSTSRAGDLILEPGLAYENLIGVLADNDNAASDGLSRVVPGDPDNSFLIMKLEGTQGDRGQRMPLGKTALSDADIGEIRNWILDGAPRSETTPTPLSTPTPTATFPPGLSFPEIQEMVFKNSCVFSLCHDAQSASGQLVLDEESAYDQLVNVVPSQEVAASEGFVRVEPGDPDNSFLITKLTLSELETELGDRMPLVGNLLEEDVIDEIRAWILRGAPEFE